VKDGKAPIGPFLPAFLYKKVAMTVEERGEEEDGRARTNDFMMGKTTHRENKAQMDRMEIGWRWPN
jgi:hypothetical protein